MLLQIYNTKTNRILDKIETDEYFEAVKLVEKNKAKYLEKGCTMVKIVCKAEGTFCKYELTPEQNASILNDKIHPLTDGDDKIGRKTSFLV